MGDLSERHWWILPAVWSVVLLSCGPVVCGRVIASVKSEIPKFDIRNSLMHILSAVDDHDLAGHEIRQR